MHDIAPAEVEEIDVTIKPSNRDTISPIGIVRDVEVVCGKVKYPADFLVLGSPQDDFCPIIFGRPFLNTVNAKIEEIDVTIKLPNRDTISLVGIVRDVEVLCEKVKYPTDFLVLGSPQDSFVPLFLVDPS